MKTYIYHALEKKADQYDDTNDANYAAGYAALNPGKTSGAQFNFSQSPLGRAAAAVNPAAPAMGAVMGQTPGFGGRVQAAQAPGEESNFTKGWNREIAIPQKDPNQGQFRGSQMAALGHGLGSMATATGRSIYGALAPAPSDGSFGSYNHSGGQKPQAVQPNQGVIDPGKNLSPAAGFLAARQAAKDRRTAVAQATKQDGGQQSDPLSRQAAAPPIPGAEAKPAPATTKGESPLSSAGPVPAEEATPDWYTRPSFTPKNRRQSACIY